MFDVSVFGASVNFSNFSNFWLWLDTEIFFFSPVQNGHLSKYDPYRSQKLAVSVFSFFLRFLCFWFSDFRCAIFQTSGSFPVLFVNGIYFFLSQRRRTWPQAMIHFSRLNKQFYLFEWKSGFWVLNRKYHRFYIHLMIITSLLRNFLFLWVHNFTNILLIWPWGNERSGKSLRVYRELNEFYRYDRRQFLKSIIDNKTLKNDSYEKNLFQPHLMVGIWVSGGTRTLNWPKLIQTDQKLTQNSLETDRI